VNASVALTADGRVSSCPRPAARLVAVVATSYAWGAVPMMTAYLAGNDGLDLPVLHWNRTVATA